jgi:hypothetical protein
MTSYTLNFDNSVVIYDVPRNVVHSLLIQIINYQGSQPQGTVGYETQTYLKALMSPKQAGLAKTE